MMLIILGIFYAAMVAAGYIIEIVFGGLGLIPATRAAKVIQTGISWNYTTILNIIFLLLAAALLVRFFPTGGAHAPDDGRQPRQARTPRQPLAPKPRARRRPAPPGRDGNELGQHVVRAAGLPGTAASPGPRNARAAAPVVLTWTGDSDTFGHVKSP